MSFCKLSAQLGTSFMESQTGLRPFICYKLVFMIHGFTEKYRISQLAAACNPAMLTRRHAAPLRYGHAQAVCKRFATKVTGSRDRTGCVAPTGGTVGRTQD